MNRLWLLRDEFYKSLHTWPITTAFLLAGCLLGWLSAYIWPSYYKANVQIYVALNPYRTYSDTNFLALARPNHSNIDDFKNWQMSQLETVILLDTFLEKTLVELQKNTSQWQGVDIEQLRAMLQADWRSAGTWSLAALNADPELAEQAATTWSKIALQEVEAAVGLARETFMIDQELQAIANQQLETSLRQEALMSTRDQILEWLRTANDFPADKPLEQSERWLVLSLASRMAQFTPPWMEILQNQPETTSTPGAYTEWLAQIISIIDDELPEIQAKLSYLESKHDDLTAKYSNAADSSLGLSPNLEFTQIEQLPVKPIRPVAIMILIGGIMGFLAWLGVQLIRITNQKPSYD